MAGRTALLIIIVLIYVVAVILALVTAVQSSYLRRAIERAESDKLLGDAVASSVYAPREGKNDLRAYAVAVDMRASNNANARALPAFGTTEIVMCPGDQQMRAVQTSFRRPSWLVVRPTRSARAFKHDVMNDITQFVVFQGHPCRVRLASDEERNRMLTSTAPSSSSMMLFVICDIRDVAAPSSSSCIPRRLFAVPSPSVDEWPSLVPGRARAETTDGTASTLVHLWGYRT